MLLAIETSCDETAAAVLDGRRLKSNIVSSQTIHRKFGGVVPEMASRAHQVWIEKVVSQALEEAQITTAELSAIAVTQGPGLLGALLVGIGFAKGLALQLNLPLIGVNHVDAHLYAAFIDRPDLSFPFIGLIVSGGHTMLVRVNGPGNHVLLGTTRDDAAGEAFDKTGKMLGFPYPAGPQIDIMSKEGDEEAFSFPRALMDGSLDFSFSGLKTSVLYFLQKHDAARLNDAAFVGDVCASISNAITTVLVEKAAKALTKERISTLVVAGGVSANSMLRNKLSAMCEAEGYELVIPKPVYCTDNAAMIAALGSKLTENGMRHNLDLVPFASYPFVVV